MQSVSGVVLLSMLLPLFSGRLAGAESKSDNRIKGQPSVDCEMDEVRLRVATEKPFLGRIFAKGLSRAERCSRNYLNSSVAEVEIAIPLNDCGMVRERKLLPSAGMMETLTVVVSFHYLFVTKVDRAFNVHCFYGETTATKRLNATASINEDDEATAVEPLTPAGGPLAEPPAADCRYEIRLDGPDGPPASVAAVGDTLYHRWSCSAVPDTGPLRILVKDCIVFDGEQQHFIAVDSTGCAVDPVILGDLTYAADMASASVESSAFKFADTSFLGFSCVVQLCRPDRPACDLRTPKCGPRDHYPNDQRFLAKSPTVPPTKLGRRLRDEVDVSAVPFAVIDSDAEADDSGLVASLGRHNAALVRLLNRGRRPPTDGRSPVEQREWPAADQQLCASHSTLAVVGAAFLLAALLVVLFCALLICKLMRANKRYWWTA